MGKKPLVGLIGLVCAGIALTGCGESTRNNNTRPKYNTPATFGTKPATESPGTSNDSTAKTATAAPKDSPGITGFPASVGGPGVTQTGASTMPPAPAMPTPTSATTQSTFPPVNNDRGSTGSPLDQSRNAFSTPARSGAAGDNQPLPLPPRPITPAGTSSMPAPTQPALPAGGTSGNTLPAIGAPIAPGLPSSAPPPPPGAGGMPPFPDK